MYLLGSAWLSCDLMSLCLRKNLRIKLLCGEVEMRLSDDGTMLLHVTNEDIDNGHFVIPEGVTSIGNRAFSSCTDLVQLTLPAGLTSIGNGAFEVCTGLTQLTFPEELTSIGAGAFWGCTGLTQLTLPEGLTSIESQVFMNCTSLTQLTLPEGLTSIGCEAFSSCTGLTHLTLPAELTLIDSYAFYCCTGLTQLTLPEELTSIDHGAFRGCTGLTQLTLPEGLTSIGHAAFLGCTGLTQLTFPEGLTSIDTYAFEDCTGLTKLTLHEGLMSIDNAAFRGCTGLTQLTLPAGLTSIGHGAFEGCTDLTQLTFPEGLTSIGVELFHDCTDLQQITVNTNSNEEAERIKNLLPEEHRSKVIQNPVYNDVLAFQKESYNKMHYSPKLSGLKDDFNFFNNFIDFDALVNIADFEARGAVPFIKAIAQYIFPTNQTSLGRYKSEVTNFVLSNTKQTARDIQFLSCAGKLQRHVDCVNRQKEIKEMRTPLFFTQHPTISLEVTEKIQAISKAINWLKGETDLTFSDTEMAVLDQGIVGTTLNQFSIELPHLPLQASAP
jgi:hypothetical protein